MGIIIYLLRVFDNDDKYVIKEILGKSDYHEGNSACRRLWNPHYPITKAVSKQLLPLYDKPMIYYPVSVFDACRNQENPNHFNSKRHPMYKDLLGDGSSLGIKFEYEIQENPNGLGEAFIIVEDFIGDENVALILKDHIPEAQVHRNP